MKEIFFKFFYFFENLFVCYQLFFLVNWILPDKKEKKRVNFFKGVLWL